MKIVINGEIKEAEELKDIWNPEGGCYEVIRFINGKPLFWKEHMRRLERSYQGVIDQRKLEEGISLLINVLGNVSENIYISYKDEGYGMYFYEGFYPPNDWYEKGIKVALIPIERENPDKKITRGGYKKKVREYLDEKKVFEGLLTDHGMIREGSRSNVFFVKEGTLITSKGDKVLPGITREKVYNICERLHYPIEERSLSISELKDVEGVFITGTSIDILPVTSIDDMFFDTIINRVYQDIHNQYEILKKEDLV